MLLKAFSGDPSGRPYVMLAAMLVANRVGCWATTATRLRRVGMCRALMSRPSINNVDGVSMSGVDGGYSPRIREATVDLPDPEEPTIAVQVFGGMVRWRFWRMVVSGRDG